MGDFSQIGPGTAQIESWLQAGGVVLTASARAARALTLDIHRSRQNLGIPAWNTPVILDYQSFLQSVWKARSQDGRLLLNSTQEESIWASVVGRTTHLATLPGAPQHRIARLAMEAHTLLCAYTPEFLPAARRASWQQDAETFSGWLEEFDAICNRQKLISPARLTLELPELLQADENPRPPLLLAGFDRLLATQRHLLDAWGEWHEAEQHAPATSTHFHAAQNLSEELKACAQWCREKLAENCEARLLVLTREASSTNFRGQLERAFAQISAREGLRFEFSLGLPLARTALARGAMLTLRWLSGSALPEHTTDWLLASEQLSGSAEETSALLHSMRLLRRRGQEQPEWTLRDFIHDATKTLPEAWIGRLNAAIQLQQRSGQRHQTPLEWAETLPNLLTAAGWPGYQPLSSASYQTVKSFQKAVETAGTLGFDGRRISQHNFLDALGRVLEETLFAPESKEAPILVAGPTESAGLTADALWFLGVDEDNWPTQGSAHPFLPLSIQREAGMPHASAQQDAEVIEAITHRLLTTAPEVHFSYPRQKKEAEAGPSRIVLRLVGAPQPLTLSDTSPAGKNQTIPFLDAERVRFEQTAIAGGASVLTAQSNCPFRAFATARLAAKGWEPAQSGLTASQRGQLLHAVLHTIWAGPPDGLKGLNELLRIGERAEFVARHVKRAMHLELHRSLRARLSLRYLELEAERLSRLITQWLEYEATRASFTVEGREVERIIQLGPLNIRLRLDRLDRLNDGSVLVIDYKSGNVKPQAWELPRPDDVQLPLYAGFALNRDREPLGGLVFAKIRAGKEEFVGRVADAKATLRPELKGTSALVRNPLTIEDLEAWRECIEQLALDFVNGNAEVTPKDTQKTCTRCDLQSLCRISALHTDESEMEVWDE